MGTLPKNVRRVAKKKGVLGAKKKGVTTIPSLPYLQRPIHTHTHTDICQKHVSDTLTKSNFSSETVAAC